MYRLIVKVMNKLIKEIQRTTKTKLQLEEQQCRNSYAFRDGGFGGHSDYWDSNYWDDEYDDASEYADHDTE